MSKYSVGDIIESGSRIGRVTEIVAKDKRWKSSGVRVAYFDMGTCDGSMNALVGTITTEFLADYLTSRLAPLEWSRVVGGSLEERYVYSGSQARRELRRLYVQETLPTME